MTEKRKQTRYSKEFKVSAVDLVTKEGYSVAEAAKSLGIRANMIYRWKEQLQAEEAGETINDNEREELKKLRKEVKQLRMEKEILKKASAFFAKEMK